MAFASRELSVLAYANGFTLWHYRSAADAMAAITGAGYFNPAAETLRVADMLVLEDETRAVGLRRVSAISAGAVTLAALA